MSYDEIKRRDVKSQSDLYQSGNYDKRCFQSGGELFVPDDLCVTIGRNGEVIRTTNRKHRVSIAKMIGYLGNIPSIVQFHNMC